MSEPAEQRFRELVRRAGPPERDPAFRLTVLERRERERLRRTSALALALAIAIVGAAVAAAAFRPAPLFAEGAALFAAAALAAVLLHAPALTAALRRLRF